MFAKTKYYTSIDNCPILVYDKIQRTSNIGHLAYKGKPRMKDAIVYWEKINNEVFLEFGLSSEYQHLLKMKQEKTQLLTNYHVKGIKSAINMAKYLEKQIEKIESTTSVKENIGKICAKLSKNNGFLINPSDISVRMFYSMLLD